MRVLVTGGAGFIGSAVVRHLVIERGYEVLNVDKLTYAGCLASLRDVEGRNGYSFVQADICDAAAIRVTASVDTGVLGVAFSPDGRRIFTTTADEHATIWDATSGEKLVPLRGSRRGARSVAFSPNGRRVFAGNEDDTAILVDLDKMVRELDAGKSADEAVDSIRLLRTLQGDLRSVKVVAFSSDGKRLLAASGVQAKTWDAESGKALLILRPLGPDWSCGLQP